LVANEVVDWSNIERHVPDIYLNRDTQLRTVARPRFLKSHEPYRPEYRLVILIVRDPRDVAVSYYHFLHKSRHLSEGYSVAEFIPTFLQGSIDTYGSWGENVGSWLGARRGTARFAVVRYEDLLADTVGELTALAAVLGIESDAERIRRAVELSTSDRMRQLETTQRGQHKFLKRSRADIPFVRTASSGKWQTDLSDADRQRIELAWGPLMRELKYLE
jgi:hypothetical protein